MLRKVRELISGQDRMKIQAHSSKNSTFYDSGSCHMIVQKKMSSGEFHLVRNVPAEAARSQRQVCPGQVIPLFQMSGSAAPATLPSPTRARTGLPWWRSRSGAFKGNSDLLLFPTSHSLLGPTRTHADTCTKGPGRDAGNLRAGKPQAARLKLLKNIFFFQKS